MIMTVRVEDLSGRLEDNDKNKKMEQKVINEVKEDFNLLKSYILKNTWNINDFEEIEKIRLEKITYKEILQLREKLNILWESWDKAFVLQTLIDLSFELNEKWDVFDTNLKPTTQWVMDAIMWQESKINLLEHIELAFKQKSWKKVLKYKAEGKVYTFEVKSDRYAPMKGKMPHMSFSVKKNGKTILSQKMKVMDAETADRIGTEIMTSIILSAIL